MRSSTLLTVQARSLRRCLTRRDLPATFYRWRLSLEPGAERPTGPDEWTGAIVLVERGVLEAECEAGGIERFVAGSLIAPGRLPVRVIRNPGPYDLSLVAVRRRAVEPAPAAPSTIVST